MQPKSSCLNPIELLEGMLCDGWAELDVVTYFEHLEYNYKEIRAVIDNWLAKH